MKHTHPHSIHPPSRTWKTIWRSLLAVAAAWASQPLLAVSPLPFYEPFPETYLNNTQLGAGATTAIWDFGNSASGSSPRIWTDASLAYPGLTNTGPSLGLRSNPTGTGSKNRGASLSIPAATTLYASFLVNLQYTTNQTRPLLGLSPSTAGGTVSSSGAVVWVDAEGRLQVAKNSATPAAPATYALAVSNTYLVVLRYQYNPGSSSDDEVALWLNPTQLGDDASIPPPTLTTTANPDVASFGSLGYFQASSYPPLIFLDEFRVATNWAAVTPTACASGTAFTVSGGGAGCAGGSGFPVALSGSQTGVDYWLVRSGVPTGLVLAGTGSAINFGNQNATGLYTVFASNTTTACVGWMNGSASITVLESPLIHAQPVDFTVATGGLAVFSVAAAGDGLTYQWRKNGVNLANGGNVSGANSANLLLSPAGAGDSASAANGYDVVISAACGTPATSTRAALSVVAPMDLIWGYDPTLPDWNFVNSNWLDAAFSPFPFHNGDHVTFDYNSSGNTTVVLTNAYLSPASVAVRYLQFAFTGPGSLYGPNLKVMVDDSATLTMNPVNRYGGGTTISNGTVNVSTPGALGSGAVSLAGGTLNLIAAVNPFTNNVNVVASGSFTGGNYEPYIFSPLSGTAGTLTIDGTGPTFRPRLYASFTFGLPIYLGGNAILRLYNDNTGQQVFNGIISGAGRIERRSPGAEGDSIFNAANTYSGGTLLRGGGLGLGVNSVSAVPPTIDSSPLGTGSLILDDTGGDDRRVFAAGGPRTVGNPITTLSGGNVTLVTTGTNDLTLSGEVTLGTGQLTVETRNSGVTTLAGVISSGGGGLTKTGTNRLVLTGINTYSGPTTNGAGTLVVNGEIGPGAVYVTGGSTLAGNGTITGPVSFPLADGSRLSPGTSIGNLTINNDLTLYGSGVIIEVNKSLTKSNDTVSVSGVLTNAGGGALAILNLGPALVPGDSFKVFNQPVLNGSAMVVNGGVPGTVWTNRLALDGSVAVLALAPPVPTTPTNLTFTVSGGNLVLSWPPNYTGWELQAQTNSLNVGVSSNWAIVPGSKLTNSVTLPIVPGNPAVFYRMRYQTP